MNKTKLLKVYCCAECSEVEVKTTTPKIRGCKTASFHRWIIMGEKGLGKYVCTACGVKVNTNMVPSQQGCRKAASHSWSKIS
ncbi:MAG: hypothetical protein ACLQQ4_18600 [Bacteroidia bacterium]